MTGTLDYIKCVTGDRRMTTGHWTDNVTLLASGATYGTAGTLAFLDTHAGAFGVIIGALTFLTNTIIQIIFKSLRRRDYLRKLGTIDPELRRKDDDF